MHLSPPAVCFSDIAGKAIGRQKVMGKVATNEYSWAGARRADATEGKGKQHFPELSI